MDVEKVTIFDRFWNPNSTHFQTSSTCKNMVFAWEECIFFNNRVSKLEPWKTHSGERSWDPILTLKMPSKSNFVDSKMVAEKRWNLTPKPIPIFARKMLQDEWVFWRSRSHFRSILASCFATSIRRLLIPQNNKILHRIWSKIGPGITKKDESKFAFNLQISWHRHLPTRYGKTNALLRIITIFQEYVRVSRDFKHT